MKWHELYSVTFKRLIPKEASIWEDEVSREVSDVGNDDLIEAVRSLAQDFADDPKRRSPGPLEVSKRIKLLRWKAGHGSEPMRQDCSYCGGSGWMTFVGWIDNTTGMPITYGSGNEPDAQKKAVAYRGDVACVCTKGDTLARLTHSAGQAMRGVREDIKIWLDYVDPNGPDGMFSPKRHETMAVSTREFSGLFSP